ncbi:hypothetical protein QVD17_15560 [Tagetes erecta]|uniref:Epidermal patterning factor-like protein n=1 Tax=Tagetes erecta TaxID=13708 RepID=A0AAD8KW62_TARER|nr:hypothetical protein QVD17_15560 [Tagetes erecta]
MSTLTKHHLPKLLFIIIIFFFFFFTSICIFKNPHPSLVSRFELASKDQMTTDLHLQVQDIVHYEKKTMLTWTTTTSRRRLTGPGSSPPRCAWRCGRCTPCKAVHVSVPPGTPVTAEYYPEAWRCKCGNRLYMPWA